MAPFIDGLADLQIIYFVCIRNDSFDRGEKLIIGVLLRLGVEMEKYNKSEEKVFLFL